MSVCACEMRVTAYIYIRIYGHFATKWDAVKEKERRGIDLGLIHDA